MQAKQKIGQQFFLTLVVPSLALYFLLRSRNQQFIIIAGTLLMGLIGSVCHFAPGSDGATHIRKVEEYYIDLSFSEFIQQSYSLLTFKPIAANSDIYIHLLGFFSGSVFGTPQLLHIFAGFILGYFYTKSVLLVIRDKSSKSLPWWVIGFVVLFLMVRSVTALNSIRMWTGMWVLFYGSYSYALRKEKRYVFISLLSIAIHFSYALFIIPVIMGYFLRKRKLLILVLYALTFFISLPYSTFSSYTPQNELVMSKSQAYVRVDQEPADVEQSESNSNFYKKWGPSVYFNYVLIALSLFLILAFFNFKLDDGILFLIASGLLLYGLGNMVDFSPSIAGRAKGVSSTFLTGANIFILTTLNRYGYSPIQYTFIKFFLSIILILSVPFFLFHLSYTINMLSVFFLAFPFFSWFFEENNLSIKEFITFFFQ